MAETTLSDCGASPREKPFGKANRLCTAAALADMRARGQKMVGRFCVVSVAEPGDGIRKFAVITSRRFHKHAVVRNRARRILKEAYRQLLPELAPVWMVMIPRGYIQKAKMPELLGEMRQLCRSLGILVPGTDGGRP